MLLAEAAAQVLTNGTTVPIQWAFALVAVGLSSGSAGLALIWRFLQGFEDKVKAAVDTGGAMLAAQLRTEFKSLEATVATKTEVATLAERLRQVELEAARRGAIYPHDV
jgi:hypothetical protein